MTERPENPAPGEPAKPAAPAPQAAHVAALEARVADLEAHLAEQLSTTQQLRASLAETHVAAVGRSDTWSELVAHSPDSIFVLDEAGRYLYANHAFCQGVARASEELLGKTMSDIFPEDEAKPRYAFLRKVFATGETLSFDVRVPRVGGDRYYLTTATPLRDATGVIHSVLGTSKNITARKEAEAALREREDLLRQLLEMSPVATAVFGADGRMEYLNRRIVELFGYELADFAEPAQWWRRAYPDEPYRHAIQTEWVALVARARADHREIERREYRITCKDGRLVDALVFGIVVGGKLFVMFEDLTQRKQAEAERLELERRFFHSQKLDSLGVLAGGVAHDFNNLLMAILGNLDMALVDLPLGSSAEPHLQQAMGAVRRAANLANRMLAYSGRGAFVLAPLDLSAVIAQDEAMLRASAAKTATLTLALAPLLPPIMADASQLQQVAVNLVANASEALGDGTGQIGVATGVADFSAAELARSAVAERPGPGRFVWLEVADTGGGMSTETLQRLFDPFFTTKFTGRGLGMSAVLGIVRGHRGAILVDSALGGGTRVRVLFPAQAAASAAPSAGIGGAPTQAAAPLGGLALVVDDESVVRLVCGSMLERLGFRVLTAIDGHAALEVFRVHGAQIRVVLLDLTMPQLDGLATFQALRELGFQTPVILCSGFSEDELASRCAGRDLAGFIQKPFSLARLREEFTRVLGAPAPPATSRS